VKLDDLKIGIRLALLDLGRDPQEKLPTSREALTAKLDGLRSAQVHHEGSKLKPEVKAHLSQNTGRALRNPLPIPEITDYQPQPRTKTAGQIELGDGWKFKWLLEGDTKPEIWGSIEAPNGSLVIKSSGWYRTDDPEAAARHARSYIGGETYY
jgi:hypothetical protein